MIPTEQEIRILLNNIVDPRRLVLVVGAGLSVSSGYPLWDAATKQALERARGKGLKPGAAAHATEKLEASDYYGVFEILKNDLPEPTYYEVAEGVFRGSNQASGLHRQLLSIGCRGIITTNFDECLISACVLERKSPPVTDMAQATATDQFFIVSPHGSILNPRSMVLSTSDWQRVENNAQFKELLSQLASSAQFVFLGYSMRDPDFNRIWDRIMKVKVFRSPAVYIASAQTVVPARGEELREKHVQVVEFADDGSFAFLPAVLTALAAQRPQVNSPQGITASLSRDLDLERYVLLCLNFSEGHKSRLGLVAKALILERMAVSNGSAVPKPEILAYVGEILGQVVSSISGPTETAIDELISAGMVKSVDDALVANQATFADLKQRAVRFENNQTAWVKSVLGKQSGRLGVDVEPRDQENVILLLDRALLELGREVAELVLFNRLPQSEAERIEDIVRQFHKEQDISGQREELYRKTLKQLILEPGDEHEEALFQRLQAYFISSAYLLDAKSEKLLADYAKNHWVYLDSSIVLPALAVGHPANAIAKRLLQASRDLGMKLKIIRDMINEVWANIKTAVNAFKEFDSTSVPLLDVLEGYVTLHGPNNGNVFLEGLLHRLRLDPSLTATEYMSSTLGTPARRITESDVIRIMKDQLGVECDELGPSEVDRKQLDALINSIEHLRKTGGRYKNRLLCEHEARQFFLIHHRRRAHPELSMKIWFVTTDYFITELQRLERDTYPLPISYTPRRWFQYLELLDIENRGSRHFSKLQPKMRFGVISGELGIEGIRAILKERKDLLSKGVVTVKELAEAAVREHHVQNSIAEYDRTTGSSRVEGSRKAAARARIQRDIRAATDKFIAVRTDELEKLQTEKESALDEANKLKKKLAKSDYVIRTLKRQNRSPKTRKRRH